MSIKTSELVDAVGAKLDENDKEGAFEVLDGLFFTVAWGDVLNSVLGAAVRAKFQRDISNLMVLMHERGRRTSGGDRTSPVNWFEKPSNWRLEPRLEMALVSGGEACPTCGYGHYRPDGPLMIDLNGSGRICPTVAQMLVDELAAGFPVRIIRGMHIESDITYLEIMPPAESRKHQDQHENLRACENCGSKRSKGWYRLGNRVICDSCGDAEIGGAKRSG